ncbi:hypothetical protein P1X14_01635 [Sphingomonas sp. AOB5]|uniref:hypothetical protein n=1 Tax=Sphingomonas sp. AOB5 TaxID=3034017 RepID=UPI0023FA3F25|nr:hypothetical protein [Sphingomonas sp. AOB5]MDF7773934.1 hypothetical protein [Sphingomonas sp. AOB5]
MTIGISGTGAASDPLRSRPSAKASSAASFETILESFKKAAAQTPEERVREAVLKKHDLNEADYDRLAPEKRKAIDQEVAAAVKKLHERKTGVPATEHSFATDKLFG